VSFVNATLVLSIGETVEEITDSGFLGTTPTLSCSLLGEDALLQVLHSRKYECCMYSNPVFINMATTSCPCSSGYSLMVILHFVMMIKLRTPYDYVHDINRISKSEQIEVDQPCAKFIPAKRTFDIFVQY
jgi:hypothetical protein